MKKTNVVIASVLKPVDDPRMYEKIACSLAEHLDVHIHIIGYISDKKVPIHLPNITFYPVFRFTRLSFGRFTASWKYYKLLLKLKPSVIIVTSIDLLIVTVVYKILFGSEIYYDIQENYMYNALFTAKFRRPLNYIIAYFLRLSELITAPFVTHFILAEQTYVKELGFIGKRYTVIENKYKPVSPDLYSFSRPHSRSIYHLLYTGTIDESYGVFDAIDLVSKLNRIDPRFHLTIIGYCANTRSLAKLNTRIASLPFVRLIGGASPVPHHKIIEAINIADIGLIAYQYNLATKNRIPTKLNEYMYYKLPMLLPKNPLWESYCKPFNSFYSIDYHIIDEYRLYQSLSSKSFYDSYLDNSALLWENEIISLVSIFYRFK